MKRLLHYYCSRIVRSICNAFGTGMLSVGISLLLCSTLLSTYTPSTGIAPFGIACAAGAWYAGISPYFACAGAMLGSLLSGNFGYAISALFLFFAAYYIDKREKTVSRVFRLLILAATEFIGLPFFLGFNIVGIGSAFGGIAVSVLSALVIGHGIMGMRSILGGRQLCDTEQLTIAVFAGIITLSMGNFSILSLGTAVIFAGICSVFSAYLFGASAVAVSVTVSAALVLSSGGDMLFIAVLAACSLISAAMRTLGKWGSLVGFSATSVLFTSIVGGSGTISYFETAIICTIFAVIPQRLYTPKKSRTITHTPTHGGSPRGSQVLQYKVSALSEVLRELSRVCGTIDGSWLGCVSDTLRRILTNEHSSIESELEAYIGTATCAKYGSEEIGDSHAMREIDGRLLIAISDGMGSGTEAKKESREALALLTDLLTVGFSMNEATDCVNNLLMQRGNGDMYATLDAAILDLSTCTAELVKHGAPPSYILRNGKVHSLYAEALPIGIIENAHATTRSIDIMSGDTIIMMTDGVSDALGRELIATIADNVPNAESAEEAASAILRAAKERGYADDMTVLLARIA